MNVLGAYPILTLADVLTGDELAQQPFAADTVLNGPVMREPLGECFARMGSEERRAFIKRAVVFAAAGDAPLEYTLAALLAWSYAPVPRLS